MKAIVMAGGEGTRLRPLTCAVPKPMVPLLDKPMLEYTVEHLLHHGISEMAFTLMYKPQVITDYFMDWPTASIEFYLEDTPLGTAGSVKNASAFVDGTFLIISGDALTDIDVNKAAEMHRQRGAKATIVLKKKGTPLEYGVVIVGNDGRVERFVEKPGWEDVFSDTINTGIYILDPDVLDLIPSGRPFDFAKDLFPLMMEREMPIYGYVAQGYWCDVGNIDSYIKAHEDLLSGTVQVKITGRCASGIYVGEGAKISNSALIQSPSFIGENAVIGDGAKIGSFSSIGRSVKIGSHVNIKRSVLHEGASVGSYAKLSACVAGRGSVIGQRSSVYEGAVVGDGCSLGLRSSVSPRVKIWPDKHISSGASVSENIVWGYGQRTGFLGKHGFVGDMGADITPLHLSKIFGAAGEYMSGKSIAVSCDDSGYGSAAAKMAAGIFIMSGCDVFMMHGVLKPVCAYVADVMNAGLAVSIKARGQRLYADLFEPELFMLSKQARRKIEVKYFAQGELLASAQCGRETAVSAAESLYISTVYEQIDRSAIKSAHMCVLVRGGKDIDEFAERVMTECDIRVKRLRNEKDLQVPHALAEENAQFAVRFARDGAHCTLTTPDGRELTDAEFETLAYYLIFSDINTKEVKLPSSVSRSAVAIAEMMGLEVAYVSEEESMKSLSMKNRRIRYDSVYAVCRLTEHIARTGIGIEEIVAMVPPAHMRLREVACDWEDIGRVIRDVYTKGHTSANEGIRLDVQNGYGYICPHESQPRIIIRAEGHTEEFAEELCGKYTEMVKEVLKR